MDIAKLALTGILGGSLAFGAAGCNGPESSGTPPTEQKKTQDYADVHACAGLNSCKGLGGCKVTEEKLAKLGKKRGISSEDAGQPHACKGLNECKGLGGCSVDAARFTELKAKQETK